MNDACRRVARATRSGKEGIAMIRVLIADDHALVRDGLRHILQNASGFEVAGEASDSTSTIARVRDTAANVLVLDLSMPGRNGVELIRQIRTRSRHCRSSC